MTAPSPAPSSSQNSEGRDDSEKTSEEECSGGRQEAVEDVAVCRRGASSGTPVSTGTSAPESADTCSQSEMRTANLNPQQPEVTVSATAADAAHGTDSWCVSIETLPDELLVKIFSHLSFTELIDVVQKVSTRWKRLSQDAELWTNKHYDIRSWSECDSDTCKGGRTDREAIQTFCGAPNLRNVSMQRGAKSRVFRALYNRCHRLSDLRLHYTQKFSYSVLKNLVEKCSRIHTLRISNELLKHEKFSEVVSQLKELRVLEMEHSFSEKSPVLRPFGDGCPRLAEVDFGWMLIDMDELRYFLNAKRNTLKALRIKWAMVGKRCVLPLLTVCANSLERLQLTEFDVVRDEAREAFTALGSLKNLQELKMSLIEPPPPGTAALAFKAGGLPKLRLLDLRDSLSLDNDAMVAISRGCPALRELSVRGADRLSDAAFSQIYCLQYLETELNVQWCRGDPKATEGLTDQMPDLEILGSIEEEEPDDDTEGHESDAELPEEENEEDAGAGDAVDAQDGGSGSDGDGDDDNSSSDSESEGENIIWGERGISDLFLENVDE